MSNTESPQSSESEPYYPNETALYCQMCSSIETMNKFKELYDKNKDYKIPLENTSFGTFIKKPTDIIENDDGTIFTFEMNKDGSYKSNFELCDSVGNMLFKKAELYIDDVLVDTITPDFIKVYNMMCKQSNSIYWVFPLPFYCDRYNTLVCHGKRKCVVKVEYKKYISYHNKEVRLRYTSGLTINKEREDVSNHLTFYEKIVPLDEICMENVSERFLNNKQIDVCFDKYRENNSKVTDIFICVTNHSDKYVKPLIKEYILYYGETIVHYGAGYLCQQNENMRVYHIKFSTNLQFGQEYKFRPFNCINEEYTPQLSIYFHENVDIKEFSISAFALSASYI